MTTRDALGGTLQPQLPPTMTCPTCNGSGGLLIEISGRDWDDPDGIFDEETCPDCGGTGEVENPDYDEEAEDQ